MTPEFRHFKLETRLLYVVCVVLAVVSLGAVQQGRRTSHRASRTADRVKTLVLDIQAQRLRNTLAACRDQNRRHDSTIRQFDASVAAWVRSGRTPGERAAIRAQSEQSRAFTVLLIDKLAPKHFCVRRARQQLSTAKSH